MPYLVCWKQNQLIHQISLSVELSQSNHINAPVVVVWQQFQPLTTNPNKFEICVVDKQATDFHNLWHPPWYELITKYHGCYNEMKDEIARGEKKSKPAHQNQTWLIRCINEKLGIEPFTSLSISRNSFENTSNLACELMAKANAWSCWCWRWWGNMNAAIVINTQSIPFSTCGSAVLRTKSLTSITSELLTNCKQNTGGPINVMWR